ncbi:lipopolysaccharide-induced tumor necrosis factor-alpha factor homolog isoform X1 [Nelusetta ayraudi]|uniref:lipopolysaccharide-induced tumor necrosis factor-alpha factor homolog isoform X1 n=1 Tax=Nelusetta ayraudi TaxID=303726 RepID=UPI003F711133
MEHGSRFLLPATLKSTIHDWPDDHLMEPPSNEDTHLHSPVPDAQTDNTLPPHCDDQHFSSPSTPPPTYGEAVQPDPFPVLTPLSVPPEVSVAAAHPPTQSWIEPPSYEEARRHPSVSDAPTFNSVAPTSSDAAFCITPPPTYGDAVGERTSVSSVQTQPVTVNQSQSATITLTSLEDVPGVARCPYCDHVGATKVSYQPGRLAWCICVLVMFMGGLFFGFCLIPLTARSLQDAHHSCSQCGKHLHTFTR